MLDNPLINAAFSFIEPLPIGLIMTLISAALLRKKRGLNEHETAGAPVVSS